jgi:hypothetical protein
VVAPHAYDIIGRPERPHEINAEFVRRMQVRYAECLPLINGAVDAVRRIAESFRLGLASSSNRSIIDTVLPSSLPPSSR